MPDRHERELRADYDQSNRSDRADALVCKAMPQMAQSDVRIPGISRRIAQNVHMSAQMTHFEQQVLEEEGSPWQFERTLFRTADGAEYHIDVRRVS